ncbi:hypothetical protein C8R47DRAFT_1137602 [Mycena vitilis]|nr:hypothetical protein C8R47DRAFT_1137602 [Mycena vitilis]
MDAMHRKLTSNHTGSNLGQPLSSIEAKAMEGMRQLHVTLDKDMSGLQLPSPFNPPLRELKVQLTCLSKFGNSDMSELVRRLLYTKPRVQIEGKFASLSPLPPHEEVAETSELVRSFFGPQGPKLGFIGKVSKFSAATSYSMPSFCFPQEEALAFEVLLRLLLPFLPKKSWRCARKHRTLNLKYSTNGGSGGGERSEIVHKLRRFEKDIVVDDNELKQWM